MFCKGLYYTPSLLGLSRQGPGGPTRTSEPWRAGHGQKAVVDACGPPRTAGGLIGTPHDASTAYSGTSPGKNFGPKGPPSPASPPAPCRE